MRTKFENVVVDNETINCELTAPYYILKDFITISGRKLTDDELIKLISEKDPFEFKSDQLEGQIALIFSVIAREYFKDQSLEKYEIMKNSFPIGLIGKTNIVIKYSDLYKLYEIHRFDADTNWYELCGQMIEFPDFVDIFGIVE